MAIQAIPTTNTIDVAEIAAAIRLLECSKDYSPDLNLDERLAMFVRAYERVKTAPVGMCASIGRTRGATPPEGRRLT